MLKHRLVGSFHELADFSLNTYHGFEQLAPILCLLNHLDKIFSVYLTSFKEIKYTTKKFNL